MMAEGSGVAADAPRRDVVDGVGWFVFGAAVLFGSWRMDRLEAQGINPYTAPGLVPGLLGLATVLLAVVMILRGIRAGGLATPTGEVARPPRRYGRLLTVIGLCVAFAAGLVGHGPPFWLAATIYVSTAIFVLRFAEFRAAGRLPQGLATSVAIGLGAGLAVSFVFEKFFFVRLP